jgi:branched-chain amino acid transport system ATP-binding protein
MLVPHGQVGENLWGPWFIPYLVRRQERRIRDRALEVLDFVDLYRLRDEPAGTLSSGQKKLLELARTLMCDPQLILLDEPGAGVNPSLMKRLVTAIEQLCYEMGVTFFIISTTWTCDPPLQPRHRLLSGREDRRGLPDGIKADDVLAYLGGQYR